ncbi:hypothetical protein NQZ68_005170 [Dissostichus eleginoides]|nr:hypothetical protein NQZ68_005170 [Dissostichus eleginoides]
MYGGSLRFEDIVTLRTPPSSDGNTLSVPNNGLQDRASSPSIPCSSDPPIHYIYGTVECEPTYPSLTATPPTPKQAVPPFHTDLVKTKFPKMQWMP